MLKTYYFNILTWFGVCLVCLEGCATTPPTPSEPPPLNEPRPVNCQSLWDRAFYHDIQPFIDSETESSAKRVTVYRLIFPDNSTELVQMNRMAILGLRIYQKDLKKPQIYAKTFATDTTQKGVLNWLPQIFPKVKTFQANTYRHPEKPSDKDVLHLHVQEVYLFVPLRSLRAEGSLSIKFQENESYLKIETLPLNHPFFTQDFVQADLPGKENPEILPNPQLVINKMAQGFCW